ncbi:MAG: sulfur carrier protein ThiS [Melioribacteraceae bacterium]|nr:sulfur carrier protein ThiS [Melioribacteraceae bacterium]
MKINLNNRDEILDLELKQITIQQLLDYKKFSFPRLIVRVNDKLVKKENYELTFIKDGDKVDIIHMISGG